MTSEMRIDEIWKDQLCISSPQQTRFGVEGNFVSTLQGRNVVTSLWLIATVPKNVSCGYDCLKECMPRVDNEIELGKKIMNTTMQPSHIKMSYTLQYKNIPRIEIKHIARLACDQLLAASH